MGKPLRFGSERAGRNFENSFYSVFDDRGMATRLAAYSRDLTSHMQAQEELEAKFRYLEEVNTALNLGQSAGG
jgi:hypothetical protein